MVLASLVILFFVGDRGFDVGYVQSKFPFVLSAMQVGLLITAISYFSGLPIGFIVGWVRVSAAEAKRPAMWRDASIVPWLLKQFFARVAYGYVEVMRGTPVFVQIWFAWSVLLLKYPGIDLSDAAFYAGIIALTLNTGAYQGEVFRGGFQAVQPGQIEAARAMGFGYWGTMKNVTFPQAFRLIIPPLTNEFIGLLKASSLLFAIDVHETAWAGRELTIRSLKVFEVFAMVTASYLIVTLPSSRIVMWLEKKLRIPGLGVAEEPVVKRRRIPQPAAGSQASRMFGFGLLRKLSRSRADRTSVPCADVPTRMNGTPFSRPSLLSGFAR